MISFGGHKGDCGQTAWPQGEEEGAGGGCAPTAFPRKVWKQLFQTLIKSKATKILPSQSMLLLQYHRHA